MKFAQAEAWPGQAIAAQIAVLAQADSHELIGYFGKTPEVDTSSSWSFAFTKITVDCQYSHSNWNLSSSCPPVSQCLLHRLGRLQTG